MAELLPEDKETSWVNEALLAESVNKGILFCTVKPHFNMDKRGLPFIRFYLFKVVQCLDRSNFAKVRNANIKHNHDVLCIPC